MPRRKYPWSVEELRRFAEKEDGRTRNRRVRRADAIQQMIGNLPDGMLFVGGFEAMRAYHEAQTSYITGCFVGCILLCQVAVEHTLERQRSKLLTPFLGVERSSSTRSEISPRTRSRCCFAEGGRLLYQMKRPRDGALILS